MRKTYIFAFAVLAAFTAACSSDDDSIKEQSGQERIPILLTANAEEQTTRAGQSIQNTQFELNQEIDVQITSSSTNYDQLVYFTSDGEGTLQPRKGVFPYYPTDQSNVNVRAIYPTGNMNVSSFTVQVPQKLKTEYMASDLMFAKVENVAPQTEAIPLTFKHKLTKIQVNLSKEGGVNLSKSKVNLIGVKKTIEFNPNTGEVDPATASSPVDIRMSDNGVSPCAAIIVPQTKPSGYLLEIILANNDILHYKTVQDINFQSGKVYTFNVKVIESNISVSTTISDWDTTPEDVEDRVKLASN